MKVTIVPSGTGLPAAVAYRIGLHGNPVLGRLRMEAQIAGFGRHLLHNSLDADRFDRGGKFGIAGARAEVKLRPGDAVACFYGTR